MKRFDFLKKLAGGMGIFMLPVEKLSTKKKVWLMEFHVRGFRYCEGPRLIESIREGEPLKLRREPDNPYDNQAIAVYYQDKKIGFVPAEENQLASRLLDTGSLYLKAEIIAVNTKASDWEKIFVGVFVDQTDSLQSIMN